MEKHHCIKNIISGTMLYIKNSKPEIKKIDTDITGIAKQFALQTKQFISKESEIIREIEKYKNNREQLHTLFNSSLSVIKENYNHIEEIKQLTNDEFRDVIISKIVEKELLDL